MSRHEATVLLWCLALGSIGLYVGAILWWTWRQGVAEDELERRWGDLATYNAEVMQGVEHDEETDQKMRAKQAEYDSWVVRKL